MNSNRRPGRHRAALALVVIAALISWPASETTGPSQGPDAAAAVGAGADTGLSIETVARSSMSTDPQSCRTQPSSAWTIDHRKTVDVPKWGTIGDLVVDRNGTATLAHGDWVGDRGNVRTSSVPSAPGDPQTLPGAPPDAPLPNGAKTSAMFSMGNHLGVDNSGALTAVFQQDLIPRGGDNTEVYDLALSERPVGGTWSPTPHVAGGGWIGGAEVHVNASGAAVAVWDTYDALVRVSYRPTAGAAWTPSQPVAPDATFVWDAGIDDTGRVVVAYMTRDEDLRVVAGTPITGWSRPRPLPGLRPELAVGSGGHVLVTVARGEQGLQHWTYTISPTGQRGNGIRQPNTGSYPDPVIAVDGTGRGTYMWWEDNRLMTRSSGRDGQWRKPCVLADHVREPRYYDDVTRHLGVNSRGDALVIYRTRHRAIHLWASYKPVGQPWTEPVKVTAGATRRYGEFRAAIGQSGHGAVAWITHNDKQLTILRMSPSH